MQRNLRWQPDAHGYVQVRTCLCVIAFTDPTPPKVVRVPSNVAVGFCWQAFRVR